MGFGQLPRTASRSGFRDDRLALVDEQRPLNGGAVLRRARRGDEDGILACIRALAEYEREPDAVQTTADDLRQALFGPSPSVFAHVVEKGGQIVAIAVWFLNYSTWTGRHGIYLEDLFVRETERRHGYGRALLKALAQLCTDRGYTRLEWSVLDWNEPSIRFYRSIGAVGMDEWTVQRLSGDALTRLAAD
jgi:GNAT superfamily N-acetyltransferase